MNDKRQSDVKFDPAAEEHAISREEIAKRIADENNGKIPRRNVDSCFKLYFSVKERCVDFLNNMLLKSGNYVTDDEYVVLDSAQVYAGRGKEVVQRQIDALGKCQVRNSDSGVPKMIVFSAMEEQTEVDFSMVFRGMEDAALVYYYQIRQLRYKELKEKTEEWEAKKERGEDPGPKPVYRYYMKQGEEVAPVVNIVIYFGNNWTGETHLYGLFPKKEPEKNASDDRAKEDMVVDLAKELASDFVIHVISPSSLALSESDLKNYKTDLGELFLYLKSIDNTDTLQKVMDDHPYLTTDAARLFEAVSGSRLPDTVFAPEGQKGDKVNMCKAIQGIVEKAENKGMDKAYGIMKELQMHTPVEEICRKLEVTEDQVNKAKIAKTEMGL